MSAEFSDPDLDRALVADRLVFRVICALGAIVGALMAIGVIQ